MSRNNVKMWTFLVFFVVIVATGFSQLQDIYDKLKYHLEIEEWLNKIEPNLGDFKSILYRLEWKIQTGDFDEKTNQQLLETLKVRNMWENKICSTKLTVEWLTKEQARKLFLLCRGPKFSDEILLPYYKLMGKSLIEYQKPICFHEPPFEGECLNGEPDLENFMRNTSHNLEELKFVWEKWHNIAGLRIKDHFFVAVLLQNSVASNTGYSDMGQVWREELEVPNLEKVVEKLYKEIEPFYIALHAVVRHKLYQKFGQNVINPRGSLPIHLLGNMWGQDWSSLIDLFVPSNELINLDERLKKNHKTVKSLALEAEDFYTSLGLPKLPQNFWKFSSFEKNENSTLCHGSAANLFHGDYRIILCGDVSMETLYVIHHEMGHIYYYMAYERQDPIFKEGSNTAIHESIGDAIMHGVLTPQHLHRLGILTDQELYNPDIETFLLLKQALNKLPELPFALLLDKYRWDIFKNKINYDDFNKVYWELNLKYRGIIPPEKRKDDYFDAGAKFHVPDNTPYIRYFLSGIIQMDVFKSLCELSLFNKTDVSVEIPLHRCDIYGSKDSGQRLWGMMEKGASIHWSKALEMVTGSPSMGTKPFLEYYEPVYKWLRNYIEKYNIYAGW